MSPLFFKAHEKVDLAQIPVLPYQDFAVQATAAISTDMELLASFAEDDLGENKALPRLFALLGQPATGRIGVIASLLAPDLDSIAANCTQFHLFEREIAERHGVRFSGHPWFKPLRFHAPLSGANDAWSRGPRHPLSADMEFFRVEGTEIHEVGVGPVHAGIIEPGHFRFQCFGEKVLHLEISLGYQHRGVETALAQGGRGGKMAIVETIAGDTTIGHSLAHCRMLESLAGCRPPDQTLAMRDIALELERLANHVGDIGAMAGDIGFLPVAAYCGRLRGEYLNMSAELTGSRFGRGLIRPGGVLFGLDAEQRRALLRQLDLVVADTDGAIDLFFHAPSVLARLERVGVLKKADADALGVMGVAGRASGRDCDSRRSYPAPGAALPEAQVSDSGDVFARADVRRREITASIAALREALATFPACGPLSVPLGGLAAGALAVGIAEGWRGRIVHVGLSDADGRLKKVKVVDPSFFNWSGLAMALRDEEISDFPLCNKSFNLSYCGFDL